MARVEVFHEAQDEERCWAEWQPGIRCPNVAAWRVQSVLNRGYSVMCEVHRQGFGEAFPAAHVVVMRLGTPMLLMGEKYETS